MADLSLTQQYLICTLNQNGSISTINTKKQICFIASCLFELQLNHCLELDEKIVKITDELPPSLNYLEPLYTYIQKESPIKLKKIINTYNLTFTDTKMTKLIATVADSLAKLEMVTPTKLGFSNSNNGYIPKEKCVNEVIQGIRYILLENDEITEEEAILAILLDKSRSLSKYFLESEQKQINAKLKDLSNTPPSVQVRKMINYVDLLIALTTLINFI